LNGGCIGLHIARVEYAAKKWSNCNDTGLGLVKLARYYWLTLAEGHLTRARISAMLHKMPLLPLPANLPADGAELNTDARKREEGKVLKRI
jgi:hypothetical protein